jgi:nitrous oxidase accessory protein
LTLVFSSVGLTTANVNDTLYVDDDGTADYTSIQAAIDAANEGDTIFVYAGSYVGPLNITKTLTLTGEAKFSTVIDGKKLGEDMITITAPHVCISEFTLRNGPTGVGYNSAIKLENADDCVIEQCVFKDNCWAAEIRTSDHCRFSDNQVIDNEGGIHIVFSDYTTVKDCTFSTVDGRTGIEIAQGCNQMISSNTLINCGVEIYDGPPSGNSIHCTMSDNTVNGKPLVYLERKNFRIVRNAGQVILNRCNGIIVRNNDLTNTSMGVQVRCSTFVHITGNTISDNGQGISVAKSFAVIIRNNELVNNWYAGLGVYHSGACRISFNEISGNDYGVYFHQTLVNALCLNQVHDNERYNYWIDSIFLPNHIEL